MISSDTPYKLVEIIQDTWPNLYRQPKKSYNDKNPDLKTDKEPRTRGECYE